MSERLVAANEFIVASDDLVAQRRAQIAAQRNLSTLRSRWNEGAGGGGIGLLSALLDAYEDVQEAEQSLATSRATREIAAANLSRARGLLLRRWGLKTDLQKDVRAQPSVRLVRD